MNDPTETPPTYFWEESPPPISYIQILNSSKYYETTYSEQSKELGNLYLSYVYCYLHSNDDSVYLLSLSYYQV